MRVTTFTSPCYPPGLSPRELDRDHWEACENSNEPECICIELEDAAQDAPREGLASDDDYS